VRRGARRLSTTQAADRRERLIGILSRINRERGEDGMDVDDESDAESEDEDEVRPPARAAPCRPS
jgi:hypothetical protein